MHDFCNLTLTPQIPPSGPSSAGDEPPIALRLSGQLMLGVVKVYARKVEYLLRDAEDTLVKIRAMPPPDQQVEAGAGAAPQEGEAGPSEPRKAGGASRKRGAAGALGGIAAGPAADRELLMEEEEDMDGLWPATDEEIFGSQPSKASMLGSPGLLSSLRKGDTTMAGGSPATPTVAYGGQLLSSGGGGASGSVAADRTLLSSGVSTAPMAGFGDDEMFDEPVPDHFDFDLEDDEVRLWSFCRDVLVPRQCRSG